MGKNRSIRIWDVSMVWCGGVQLTWGNSFRPKCLRSRECLLRSSRLMPQACHLRRRRHLHLHRRILLLLLLPVLAHQVHTNRTPSSTYPSMGRLTSTSHLVEKKQHIRQGFRLPMTLHCVGGGVKNTLTVNSFLPHFHVSSKKKKKCNSCATNSKVDFHISSTFVNRTNWPGKPRKHASSATSRLKMTSVGVHFTTLVKRPADSLTVSFNSGSAAFQWLSRVQCESKKSNSSKWEIEILFNLFEGRLRFALRFRIAKQSHSHSHTATATAII